MTPRLLPARSTLLAAASALALGGCNIERGTAFTVGDQLTVADQVAIEAAIAKVAGLLEENAISRDDSTIADFARVAARLVRLQGRAARVAFRSASPTADTMFAVAVRSVDEITGIESEFVLAWRGLDATEFTVERALFIEQGGIDPVTSAVREVEPAGSFIDRATGTLTFAEPVFSRGCQGLGDTESSTCRVGSVQVTSALSSSAPSTMYGTAGPAEMVGFELIVR